MTVALYTRRFNQYELHSNMRFGAHCRHGVYVPDSKDEGHVQRNTGTIAAGVSYAPNGIPQLLQ